MKKLGNVIFFLFIAGFIVHKIVDTMIGSPSSSPTTDDQSSEQPSLAFTPYALRASDDSWPNNTGAQDLATDLLTKNYYLVLDGSGSMSESRCSGNQSKMDVAKQSVRTFLQQIPDQANVGVFVFDKNGTQERVSLNPKNGAQLDKAVSRVVAGGGTPLRVAVDHGFQALTRQAKKQLGYGEYNLVVITDGHASENYDPRQVVNGLLEKSPVVLHTIGFCIGDSHSLNQKGLAFYKAANDPSGLSAGLNDVLAETNDFTTMTFQGP